MSRICVWISLPLLTATLVLSFTDVDFWPKFGCHPYNDTYFHRNAVKYRPMSWTSCLEPYDKWNGRCPKVCVLLRLEVLSRTSKDGPLIFKTDTFITELKKEMGYGEKDTPPAAAQEILSKVKSELQACLSKYPEFAQLNIKEHSCDPWSNLTTCIDMAVGC